MLHIEEPDLMRCQMCGNAAALRGGNYEAFGHCTECQCQGPRTQYNIMDEEEGTDDYMAAEQTRAAELWNRMQAWIAKGRLSDGLAPPSPSDGAPARL